MEYRVIRNEDLEHGLFGNKGGAKKGSTWDKHKYIAKQKKGDGWRYFYSQAELAATRAKKTGQKVVKNVKRNASDLGRKISRSTENLKTRAYEAVGDAKVGIQKATKKFKKFMNSAISNGKKRIDKALNNIGNYSTQQLNNAKNTVNKGKEFVSDFFKGEYGYFGVEGHKNEGSGGAMRYLTGNMSDKTFSRMYTDAVKKDIAQGRLDRVGSDVKKAIRYAGGEKESIVNKFIDNIELQLGRFIIPNIDHDYSVDWSTIQWFPGRKSKKKK